MNKKLLFTAALALATSFGFSQISYDDFDNNAAIIYKYVESDPDRSVGKFNEAEPNPSTATGDGSALVGAYGREVQQVAGLVFGPAEGLLEDVTDYVNGTKKMSMDMYMPSWFTFPSNVRVTLQNGGTVASSEYPLGKHSSYIATYDGSSSAGEWVTLVFDYDNSCHNDANIGADQISEIALEFDYDFTDVTEVCGQAFTGLNDIYYFDNFMGPGLVTTCSGTVADETIFDDFDCQRNFLYEYSNGGFGAVPNPNVNTLNNSEFVGKFRKSTFNVDGAFGGSVPSGITSFTIFEYTRMSFMLYNPNGVTPNDTLKVGFQDASSSSNQEALYFYLAAPQNNTDWIKYEIKLDEVLSPSDEVTDIVFLWNPHTTTADDVYIDNIRINNGVVGVEEETLSSVVTLYPNPVSEMLTINSTKLLNEVKILDLSGKVIVNENNLSGNETKLDLTLLSKGVYNVVIGFKDNSKEVRKIIK